MKIRKCVIFQLSFQEIGPHVKIVFKDVWRTLFLCDLSLIQGIEGAGRFTLKFVSRDERFLHSIPSVYSYSYGNEMVKDLDRKMVELGFVPYSRPKDTDGRSSSVIDYHIDFGNQGFAESAVKLMIPVLRDVLEIQESLLRELRMHQETFVLEDSGVWVPLVKHLLNKMGVKY